MIKASVVQGKVHIVTDDFEILEDMCDRYEIKISDKVKMYEYGEVKKYCERYLALDEVLMRLREEGKI